MKHLKLFFALFAMLALSVGNAWGETVTYQHVFNKKPSTGNSVALSSVNWKIEATALNNYNSNNYAGVQIGSSKAAGSITLTSTTDWDYDGYGKITEVRLWLNTGGSTVTPTVTIGGKSANSDGTTVVKNSKAGTDWTKATKVTFTPVADGNTGVVVINVSTVNAGYICAMEIDCEPASSGSGTEEPVLSVEPNKVDFGTKNIYFESEKQGSLEIDITGQNLTGDVTAEISGADASVFTLSKKTFTPNSGEVSEKLSVLYSVSEVKNYVATLKLSSDKVDAIELPITLTTVNKKPTIYTKVTDAATLSAGDKVIFVYEAGKVAAGKISNTTGGYLDAIDITQALNTTANPATVSITDEAVVEYTLDGTAGAWELISTSGKLSEKTANSSSAVDLAVNKGTKWTISIASGNATIKGTTNTIKYNTSSPRFKTYYSGQTAIQLYAISVPKYAVNFAQPEGGELIVKNGENAIVNGNTFAEGIKLTVTANPANGYEGGTVVVKDADGHDVTTTVYADGVLTMPAYAVTISATFEKKECTLLATPTVSATTTYNSATLSWGAVTNAAKYSVKVGTADAVETTETSYDITGLTAETTYTYQVQAIAEAGQDTYCDSKVAEGTFTTATAPTATLTLKDIVGTTTQTGALNSTITLPTTAAECSKTFVGWSAVEIPEPGKKPATNFYDRGAEYTLAAETQTLYAVYADGEAGEALQWTIKNDDLKVLDSSQNSGYAKYAGDQEKDGVTFNITSVMPATGENAGKIQMQAEKATIYNKTAMPGNIISIAIDGVDLSVYEGTEVIASTPSSGAITKNSEVYNFSSGKRYFHLKKSTKSAGYANSITVTYASVPTYSNYSTTCAAALEKPTFSVAEGTYTEEKSIELRATEGKIYYTLDGTDPTESSTQYTAAINLDECGTTTIKAIAISSDSESPIASATYTINLPIPANSASDPYTSDETKDVYASGCYNDEWVYVTGTVQTAQYYSSSGSYTITLTDGFQFYYFFKDDQQTKFANGEIETGDVLVACGQLSEHNGNCQLANNCYLVSIEEYTDPKTDISNTIDNPYTVTQADELIDDITSDLTKTVFVKGVVTGFATNKVTIRDTREGTEYIELYKHTLATGITPLSQGDLIIATGTMAKYNGTTYQMNEGCQVVWKKAAATIEIANVSLEVGETHTIDATIAPAEAASAVTYTIKSGSEYISLSGNVITANEVGTATITATIETAAGYMGKTVDFTVTVNAKSTKEKVVILAEYEGQWYAMKAQYVTGKTSHLAPLPVTYFEGKLYDVDDADKALIEWERVVVDGKATFSNNSKYLTGKSDKTDLTLAATACEWTISEDSYLIGARTFLYNAENNWFRNFGTSNAGDKNYSGMPTVTAPEYATGDVVYTRNVTNKYGTICLPYASVSTTGAIFYRVAGKEEGSKVYLESVDALEAGVPYIFEKTANTITVTCQGEAVAEAGSANGLVGNFTNEFIVPADNYILYNNAFIPADGTTNKVNAYRAYLDMDAVTGDAPVQMPGRRYIGMSVQGENEATGFENITAPEGQTIKAIVNGQLIIIRGGEKFNAQGQKL